MSVTSKVPAGESSGSRNVRCGCFTISWGHRGVMCSSRSSLMKVKRQIVAMRPNINTITTARIVRFSIWHPVPPVVQACKTAFSKSRTCSTNDMFWPRRDGLCDESVKVCTGFLKEPTGRSNNFIGPSCPETFMQLIVCVPM